MVGIGWLRVYVGLGIVILVLLILGGMVILVMSFVMFFLCDWIERIVLYGCVYIYEDLWLDFWYDISVYGGLMVMWFILIFKINNC